MTERKRATKGDFETAIEHKKKVKDDSGKNPDSNQLKCYLSIIDDLHTKLFSPSKYPDITSEEKESLCSWELGFEEFEKSTFWGIANAPDWKERLSDIDSEGNVLKKDSLESLKNRIVESYTSWVDWMQYSEYQELYLPLVESLHPATINSLPKIIPEFQTPDQIRVFQELESVYDPQQHSKLGITDFKEFKEAEFSEYQKLVNYRSAYLRHLADLLDKEKDKIVHWPPAWIVNNVGIMKTLNEKKQFLPILKFLRDHALYRTENTATGFGKYIKDGQEYAYIVTKINTNRIAESLNLSQDTVKLYVRAMKKAGFIRSLKNPYYAIGYWNSKYRSRIFFLTNTPENRQKLINFSIK
jgi:hypothetical protein